MKKNLKPKAYIYPLPVLVIGTYDENGTPDAMTAAWGTVYDYNMVSVCLAGEHKTVKNLLLTKSFTVSMADVNTVKEADYLGVVSANDVPDKVAKIGFVSQKAQTVNAPLFEALPLTLECKLVSYDEESGIAVGEVLNVLADEDILNADGKIDLNKFKPICYDTDTHGYYAIGERVGNAFSDGLKLK